MKRFMQGYRDTLDWLFSSDPQASKAQAQWAGVSEAVARRSRDEFAARETTLPDRIAGRDALLADAVTFKIIAAPLSAAQVAELIRLPAPIR